MKNKKSIGFVGPLTTLAWGQGDSYNKQVPYYPDYVVGCTGTALSQIMKYYNWPKKAKGILPAYDNYSSLDIDGYEYQWDLMLDDYTHGSTIEQQDAVAAFCYHVAFALRSDFGSATPANPTHIEK
ncbi:C10 family peptidase [Cedecea sp. NFIX57]|uniref:C10 family peptidase n=1 Tax=Cedecea sp. NFIX57 TaxID=1566286 RepID=UPI000A1CA7AE|nr:C10 family peptidase [Cedecea sp. NFIX57]